MPAEATFEQTEKLACTQILDYAKTFFQDPIKLRGPLSHNINFTAFSKRCKSAELNRFLLKTLSSSSAYETY